MNWKKLIAYLVIALVAVTILFVIWANRGIVALYGGHTDEVDYEQFNPSSDPVAITNVHVLTPNGEAFIPGQTVLIERGLITSVDTVPVGSADFQIIDGAGKYLIPGLIDSHVHLFKSPNDLLLYVANGVTQIREMIGEPDHLKWRQQIEEGRIGPDMFVVSPRLGSFEILEGWFMVWSQGFMNIRDAKEAEKTVEQLFEDGYDGVKVYSHLNKESSSQDIKELVVTTKSDDPEYDFYSRCFCPWIGINEDPITGAAHSVLAKYWGDRLRKKKLSAFQLSKRGGYLNLELIDDQRLEVRSNAHIAFEGQMNL